MLKKITQEELDLLLCVNDKKHDNYTINLRNYNLKNLTFSNMHLKNIDFSGSDLSNAKFEYSTIFNTNFDKTSLSHAIFANCALRNCSFSESQLDKLWVSNTEFHSINFYSTHIKASAFFTCSFQSSVFFEIEVKNSEFSYSNFPSSFIKLSNFISTNFFASNFTLATFLKTHFIKCDLNNTNFFGATILIKSGDLFPFHDCYNSVETAGINIGCPEEGSFIGFKKCQDKIVKLRITEDALRSSATSRGCRCSKAEVLSITNLDGSPCEKQEISSNHDSSFKYKVGEIVEVKDFDPNRWNECSTGIHFFITRDEAVNYDF